MPGRTSESGMIGGLCGNAGLGVVEDGAPLEEAEAAPGAASAVAERAIAPRRSRTAPGRRARKDMSLKSRRRSEKRQTSDSILLVARDSLPHGLDGRNNLQGPSPKPEGVDPSTENDDPGGRWCVSWQRP